MEKAERRSRGISTMTEICQHEIDPVMLVCTKCYLTAEAIAAGRDRPATWDDVNEAYNDGHRVGIEIGQLLYKQRRRDKLIEVGYYLCLRRLGNRKEVT